MRSDPDFAVRMAELGIEVPVYKRSGPWGEAGSPRGVSPTGWTWHHALEPGAMQLVPRWQHQGAPMWTGLPGAWQYLLHPGDAGGFKLWGKDY